MIKLLYFIFCNQKNFDILLDDIEKQNKRFAFINSVNTISSVNTCLYSLSIYFFNL